LQAPPQVIKKNTQFVKYFLSETFVRLKGGLALLAMRYWSQGPSQSPIQNVKKWAFLEEFRGLFEFFCMDGRRGLLMPVRQTPDGVYLRIRTQVALREISKLNIKERT
jgi:hypothetical protein